MSELSRADRAELRRFLVKRFNLSELKTLSFDLGVDYELFPHGTKAEFTRELISYFERRGNVRFLVEEMMRERQLSPELAAILANLEESSPREKVQMILPQLLLEQLNKPEVLSSIGRILGIPADEVALVAAAAGSVRLLIGLPGESARRLVAMQPKTIGGHAVGSVALFSELTAAAQSAWLATALTNWSSTAGGLVSGFTLPWMLRLLVWLGAGVLLVAGVGSALPGVTVINRCRIPIEQELSVPRVGEFRISIPAREREHFVVPPGEYALRYNDDGILSVRAPWIDEFGAFPAGELPALFQGEPIDPGRGRREQAGIFDEFELILCPDNPPLRR